MTAIVVGGGPAGAAIATRLATAGRKVTVVERESGPHDKVCGEFISAEAAVYLASLGVHLDALGAVPIDRLRLCVGAGDAVVSIPLPFAAFSLSRRVLDEVLLARAASSGATVRRGLKVQALSRSGDRWIARLDGREELMADAAFLATGKHDLRGHKRPPGSQNDLVAFKMHWQLAPEQRAELERHVELVTFDGGYAGLQPVEGGDANLCLVVRRARLAAWGQRWDELLTAIRRASRHLDRRLIGATPRWERALALSSIPYGHVLSPRASPDEPWRLGDQAVVIPSFSGDGIAIALHSAELAAQTFLRGAPVDVYARRLARDVRGQVSLAALCSQALVRGRAQSALGAVARLWPSLVTGLAARTRVPNDALVRACSNVDRAMGA